MKSIPFNRAHLTGDELENVRQAYSNGELSGNGYFSKSCEVWLEAQTKSERALLTHSCTGALEMAAILLDLSPGDEVIMPSYTFVSTANAVVLRGAVPIFADIRSDTLNIDEAQIESLITPRTKSIWVVHYAGVSCAMDEIIDIANRYGLTVVEDAAQGIMASYKGRALGSIGDIGTISFHETKNVTCGEGGALILNRKHLIDRAEIVHEKGTDRRNFNRGMVDKYTWQDIGSSFVLGELTAAFLRSQFDVAQNITSRRLELWNLYHKKLSGLEADGYLRRPVIPDDCVHNAHMYYILLDSKLDRAHVLSSLKANGILAVFHYVPLHMSPVGRALPTTSQALDVTEDLAARIVRLPLWVGLEEVEIEYIVDTISKILTE